MQPGEARVHTISVGPDVLGFIAIDSTVGGKARGGLRMIEDVTAEEVVGAARAMTLKYGFLGLPQGGAKGGLFGRAEDHADGRHARLHAFAEAARPFLESGAYVPDADMGTTAPEIRRMMQSVGLHVGPREWRSNRSGEYTARSCCASAMAVARSLGLPIKGARVAIEGFGKVGSALAGLLAAEGASIVAVSTSHGAIYQPDGLDVVRLQHAAATAGSRFVDDESGRVEREALLELPVDVLLPCARFHSIHRDNVRRVQAQAVVAGANDPVSPEAEAILMSRRIVHPPDFISNSGGVLGGTLEFAGTPFAHADRLVGDFVGGRVETLLDRARRERRTLRSIAEADALARHAATRDRAESPNWKGHLVRLGLSAYRQRLIPSAVMGRLAPRYVLGRLD